MKKNKSRLIISLAIIGVSLIMFVAGILLLPDTLTMQISTGGNPTTMAKPLGLLIPLALSIIFSVMYAKEGSGKSLIVAIAGLAVNIFTFVYNFWIL